jgi:RNA polymerase-binding transcription factor DksA
MNDSMGNLGPVAQWLRARGHELRARIAAMRANQCGEHYLSSLDIRGHVMQRNDQVMDEISARAECELFRVKEALRRIQAGTYGVCTTCGSPIGSKRLCAIPYAERCSDCSATSPLSVN